MRLFGLEGLLDQQSIDLNMNALLVYVAVIGFSGSLSIILNGLILPSNETERWLVSTIQGHAQRVGIGMLEVAIYQSPVSNAFTMGMNNALVSVSSGLLQSMTQDEVEAVLAHEISHISNGDMITMALIQGVVNTFIIVLSRVIGHLIEPTVFKTQRGHGPAYWITSIIAELVLGILASIIVRWFSKPFRFIHTL